MNTSLMFVKHKCSRTLPQALVGTRTGCCIPRLKRGRDLVTYPPTYVYYVLLCHLSEECITCSSGQHSSDEGRLHGSRSTKAELDEVDEHCELKRAQLVNLVSDILASQRVRSLAGGCGNSVRGTVCIASVVLDPLDPPPPRRNQMS